MAQDMEFVFDDGVTIVRHSKSILNKISRVLLAQIPVKHNGLKFLEECD